MTTLILIVLFGIGFALFATQNTSSVTVQLAGYILSLPLYIVAFGSLLVGLFISWILSIIDSIAIWVKLSGRENQLYETRQAVEGLENRIHELELENTQLRGKADFRPVHGREVEIEKPDSEIQQKSQHFFDRLKHNLNF